MLKIILFADDTNLFKSGYDLPLLCSEISKELNKLYIWFNVNKLSLNIAKTNFMIFSNKSRFDNVSISINNVPIERVECTKFLGVLIDNKLSWKPHINKVASTLSKSLAILYRCNKLLNRNALRTLYCSLFLSHLTYCCEVWGTTYKSNLDRLVILQKKALRMINNEYDIPSNVLFSELKLLKLRDIVYLKCCCLMFRAYRCELPTNLQSKFILTKDDNIYNLRNRNKFKINYVRTTKRQHCLSVYGVKMLNSIPNSIASLVNIHMFKKHLKKNILEQYKQSY